MGRASIHKGTRSAFKVNLPVTPLGRPRHGWEDNIRMDLKEIGVNMRNLIDLTQDRDYWRILANAALNLGVIIHGVS